MSANVRVTRTVRLPDPLRVERYLRVPELGPRILFFSGGTALRDLSRQLKFYTHNSIHLISPFDSGGSSAKLRDAFGMLSVGDLRNRLMALADESVRGNPEIYELFSYRLPEDVASTELDRRLEEMIAGKDSRIASIPQPMQRIIRVNLRHFADRMPSGFDLSGASIGNLVLAGGYLETDRDIESVVFLFSQLVEVRGVVRTVADVDLQLACELEDGTLLIGQHLVTGKEVAPITSPIRDMYLVARSDPGAPAQASVHPRVARLISNADLICYPIGSFYSSILANLLPTGIGSTIASAQCPKVYIPNAGPKTDPEQLGMGVGDCVETLIRFVRRDAGADIDAAQILDLVLIDPRQMPNFDRDDRERIEKLGVSVAEADMMIDSEDTRHDADKLAEILLSLA